ncbi:AI-2E family transporter [Candidatus Woesearchaeota archaeon]|nr:AI-2E family transporter [Candidatus Woesearchaeota archaeon]
MGENVDGSKIDYRKYGFIAVFLILTYLCYLLLKPFVTYAIIGLALIIAAYPVYEFFLARTRSAKLSSVLCILLILLIIFIPLFFAVSALIKETVGFFSNKSFSDVEAVASVVSDWIGRDVDLASAATKVVTGVGEFAMGATVNILDSVTNLVIGILIMLTIMYYGFVEGSAWLLRVRTFMPFKEQQKNDLFAKIKDVIVVVLYGDVLIAIIQGALGGTLFFFMGIPNPVFWGFIMAVLAFLPFVGTGFVWVPAALIMFSKGDMISGIIILTVGLVVIGGVDYLVRPKIIAGGSRIHPLSALIGAFGGLKLFGFSGLVLGPLIASIFEALVQFYYEEKNSSSRLAVDGGMVNDAGSDGFDGMVSMPPQSVGSRRKKRVQRKKKRMG